MTTKVLTGSYASGYTLQSPVTILTLAASGYVGGTGIATPFGIGAAYTVVNLGKINGSGTGFFTGNGVFLYDGGRVTNGSATDTSASIAAYRGVNIQQAVGTVANFGTIAASQRSGVLLDGGGSITNGSLSDRSALISSAGADSAAISCGDYNFVTYEHSGVGGTIANFGTITSNKTGIQLLAGGSITNGGSTDTRALIRGAGTGVLLYSYTGAETATVTNFGTIAGAGTSSYDYGVSMTSLGEGSTLTNGSSKDAAALVTGYTGVAISVAGATVVNFATIQGTGGVAVYLGAAGDTLVLEAGSTLVGGVGAAAASTIDAVAGVATIKGDLANAGAIVGAGTVTVAGAISLFAPGASVSQAHVSLGGEAYLSGDLIVEKKGALAARRLAVGAKDIVTVTGAASSLTVTGGAQVGAGAVIDAATGALVQISGALTNAGTMRVTGGTMLLTGSLTGAGSFQINRGTLQEGGTSIGNVAFTGTTGVLELGLSEVYAFSVVMYKGAVSGLSTTGTSSLDFLAVPFVGQAATYVDNGQETGGVLTVSGDVAGQGQEAEVTLAGNYTGVTWVVASDGHGGTTVTASTPAAASSPHALVAAIAGFAPPVFGAGGRTEGSFTAPRLLLAPRAEA